MSHPAHHELPDVVHREGVKNLLKVGIRSKLGLKRLSGLEPDCVVCMYVQHFGSSWTLLSCHVPS